MSKEAIKIKIRDGEDFIKLGQLLKATALVSSGVEAKIVIQEGHVLVNNQVDTRRGKKIYPGDIVTFEDQDVRVEK